MIPGTAGYISKGGRRDHKLCPSELSYVGGEYLGQFLLFSDDGLQELWSLLLWHFIFLLLAGV